jgi:hypothetical protein
MKQTLFYLSIVFLFFSSSASAQIAKGNHYMGGSFDLNYDSKGTTTVYNFNTGYNTYTNNKILNLQINPQFGYFMSDKWTIGIQPSYSRVSGTEISNFTSTSSSVNSYVYSHNYHTDFIGLGVTFRYYYMFTDKIGFFPEFGMATSNNTQDFSNGTLSIGGGPNLVFFATPKLGLNFGFGNLGYSTDYQFKDARFNLGFNNYFTFGLNFYCGKK